ncbi:MAG TPA: ABC-F family ATP-binding cassette domain-containing protein, partial [Bacillota bacterium]
TRLALARILLTDNDILFLDEPTNYLDWAANEWLGSFLRDYRGAVVLVSHDRYFLDQVVQGFYAIEQGKATRFRGNYTAFRQYQAEQYEAALKAYLKQEKEITRMEKFVREARATEKSKRKAHCIEKRLDKVERLVKPVQDRRQIKLDFEMKVTSAKKVLEVAGITKAFATKTVLNGVSFTVYSGDKIGLIGPNGVGKTTLLKIILGLEQPDQGLVRLGYQVEPGYFSQLTSEKAMEGTPFSQIMEAADLDNTQARTILGRFLFSGDAVFKPVSDLSGGERRRLELIKLMLSKANFLVMDEPTNHLDLPSIEVIETALQEFNGTLLVVSHDRYFLNKVVKRFLVLQDGQIHEYSSYQQYLDQQNLNSSERSTPTIAKPKNQAQLHREFNKELQRQIRRRQKDLEETEAAIDQLEQERSALLGELNDPAVHSDYQRSLDLSLRLSELEATLESFYQKWEAAQKALSDLEVGQV